MELILITHAEDGKLPEIATALSVSQNKPLQAPKKSTDVQSLAAKGESQKNPPQNNPQAAIAPNHHLWQAGDPKEGSFSFMRKYDCFTYAELENKS